MIVVDSASPTPPYEQIRQQLTDLIRSGALDAGQRLPAIRQLAGDLRVAPGTVARAYSEAESAGLIESSRATGTRVKPGQQSVLDLQTAAAQYVEAARANGAERKDALSAVRAVWGPTVSTTPAEGVVD